MAFNKPLSTDARIGEARDAACTSDGELIAELSTDARIGEARDLGVDVAGADGDRLSTDARIGEARDFVFPVAIVPRSGLSTDARIGEARDVARRRSAEQLPASFNRCANRRSSRRGPARISRGGRVLSTDARIGEARDLQKHRLLRTRLQELSTDARIGEARDTSMPSTSVAVDGLSTDARIGEARDSRAGPLRERRTLRFQPMRESEKPATMDLGNAARTEFTTFNRCANRRSSRLALIAPTRPRLGGLSTDARIGEARDEPAPRPSLRGLGLSTDARIGEARDPPSTAHGRHGVERFQPMRESEKLATALRELGLVGVDPLSTDARIGEARDYDPESGGAWGDRAFNRCANRRSSRLIPRPDIHNALHNFQPMRESEKLATNQPMIPDSDNDVILSTDARIGEARDANPNKVRPDEWSQPMRESEKLATAVLM